MTAREIQAALAEHFTAREVKYLPITVSKKNPRKALASAYVDAHVIEDRLDRVLGVAGWRDEYTVLSGGCVMCTLSLLIEGQWVSKSDVGGPSEQPDPGDKLKAAFSDSLKRAAVKWGVARYLHQRGPSWMDYDPDKKQILAGRGEQRPEPQEQPQAPPPRREQATPPPPPTNGTELIDRLEKRDAALAGKGKCQRGSYHLFVLDETRRRLKNAPSQVKDWNPVVLKTAWEIANEWRQKLIDGQSLPAASAPKKEPTLDDLRRQMQRTGVSAPQLFFWLRGSGSEDASLDTLLPADLRKCCLHLEGQPDGAFVEVDIG